MRSLLRPLAALAIAATAAVATPAAAEWREASSDHFLIYADSSEASLRGFAERLERFHATVQEIRPAAEDEGRKSNRVVVFVVPTIEAVQKICGGSGKCGSIAGFYIPRVGNSVAYSARSFSDSDTSSDTILFHEYAHHHMLSNASLAYPRWMGEGFAEFLSTVRFQRGGAAEIGRPANHRAYGLQTMSMPIDKLFDPPKTMSPEQTDLFYGRAWALTHMLTFDTKRAGQLSRYAMAINSGTANIPAATAAFGDLAVLNRQLNSYIDGSMKYVTLEATRLTPGPIAMRRLSAGEAAMMPVRMVSDRGVSRAEALALLPDARKRAAPFPTDPAVQTILAEAEYDAGNDVEAEAAVDRALAADPVRRDALLYKGRILVERADEAGSRDPAIWRAARGWFLKANRADPDAAEPLVEFYRSYFAEGVQPTANAAAGLMRAFDLSPHDRRLRMEVARQLLIDEKPVAARKVLLPLAYDPHNRGEGNFAARLVELIDKGTAAKDVLRANPNSAAGEKSAEPDKPSSP